MAFNLTSWGKKGRGFGRGSPPPRGSLEYIAVGDKWMREPHSQAGFSFNPYEIGFTELDAANRWANAIDRSVKQARRVHGDKILSRDDESRWDKFMTGWRTFAADMNLPGGFNMMLAANKTNFDGRVTELRTLRDDFSKKGMSLVPVPYMGELLELLRTMPKRLTAGEMQGKLLAGAKCGEKMLDENMVWYKWLASSEHRPLSRAIEDAKVAADIYGRSRSSGATYSPGDPAYDEFLRRLTKIWIEAAGLYGFREVEKTAKAALKDALPSRTNEVLWLLALGGVSYLGAKWLFSTRQLPVVGVPDAYPNEGEY
jgi:hypothetical protein